jgi:nucleotide-binding universal stress UspA family protein
MPGQGRYKKIVVPLDGSGWSQRAIPHALDIARANDSEVILLHIFRPVTADFTDQLALAGQEAPAQELREATERKLMSIASEIRTQGIETRLQIMESKAIADSICEFITAEEADLVIMATHGRKGIARLFLGSIAASVMEGVEVPVMLIHPDKE